MNLCLCGRGARLTHSRCVLACRAACTAHKTAARFRSDSGRTTSLPLPHKHRLMLATHTAYGTPDVRRTQAIRSDRRRGLRYYSHARQLQCGGSERTGRSRQQPGTATAAPASRSHHECQLGSRGGSRWSGGQPEDRDSVHRVRDVRPGWCWSWTIRPRRSVMCGCASHRLVA